MMPNVSVCIASYNHGKYLSRCLDSILSQTYQDFEIVLVDDGSTDNSHEILLDYQARYPEKIRYTWHPNHENKGISITTNLAIEESKGRYIAFIGSDDMWRADKLEMQISILESSPDLGMVYSYAVFIDEQDNPLSGLVGTDITHDPNPTGRMIQACHQPAMTVVIRRDLLEKIGLFEESLITSDWDLMIRFFAHEKAGFIAQPLAGYRIHQSNLSKNIDPLIELKRYLEHMNRLEEKSSSIGGNLMLPRNQATLALQLCFYNLCMGNEEKARHYLHLAFLKDETLSGDIYYLNDWMNQWKPKFCTPQTPHLGFWVIKQLNGSEYKDVSIELGEMQVKNPETRQHLTQKGIAYGQTGQNPERIFMELPEQIKFPKRLREQIKREIYSSLLFTNFNNKDVLKTRQWWLEAVRNNPFLLRKVGVWSIGIKAWLRPSFSQ